jgi:radical SAM protein with 4Fe4S-binding SPASM domain
MAEKPITYKELSSPVAIQMELTPRCNNICNYCYNSWRGDFKYEKELSLNKYLEIAKKIVDMNIFEVVLTGGEPLLRKDILYPLANYFSKNGLEVGLNTNLVLIDKEDPKKIKDNGINKVLGSLSSYKREIYNQITQTNNFDKALRGINLLVEGNVPLGINMVVKQENKNHVYETGSFISDFGVKVFCATPAMPSNFLNPKEELNPSEIVKTLDDLLMLKEKKGLYVDILEPLPRCLFINPEKYEHFLKRDCGAGKITAVISSSGNMRPCTHVAKEYGNVLKEDFSKIWKKMEEWRDGSFNPNACMDCNENLHCSMGCRESSSLKGENYKDLDPWANPSNIGNRKLNLTKIEIKPEEVFKFDKGLKFREEGGGKLIYSPKSMSIGLVNNDFFNFIVKLKKKRNFSLEKVVKEYGANSSNLIKYLKSKDFIKSIKEVN